MQHVERFQSPSPWRTATFVVGAVAAAELLGLLVLGGVRLVPERHASTAQPAKPPAHAAAPVRRVAAAPSHPLRPRTRVRVLVLNGNGVAGAAAAAAQSLQVAGYRIGGATNAQRRDYARSMVMYVPGWLQEARRLARDADVRMVAPLDGLPLSKLRGSKLVLLLGT